MPRILLADDHPKVRRHVRDALESQTGWEVCAEASTGREAVAMAEIHTPDIAVLDLSMPELNGLEAAREISRKFPQTVVFILTMHDAHELIREVLAAGARACLTKSNLQHLIDEVQNALSEGGDGAMLASPDTDGVLGHTSQEPEIPILSAHEWEIVRLLAQAKSNREIALSLSITVKAVEANRAAIMRKLRIQSVLDLVDYAVRKQLV